MNNDNYALLRILIGETVDKDGLTIVSDDKGNPKTLVSPYSYTETVLKINQLAEVANKHDVFQVSLSEEALRVFNQGLEFYGVQALDLIFNVAGSGDHISCVLYKSGDVTEARRKYLTKKCSEVLGFDVYLAKTPGG